MRDPGIHLQYRLETDASARRQRGADIEHPLFDLLAALQDTGSIRQAALALGMSYRHVWGELRRWEDELGQTLVGWSQGRQAQLTPLAHRLLWAERQARTRLTPHIEALRAELAHAFAQALDDRQPVLALYASHDLALPMLQTLTSQEGAAHLSLRFAGSVDALRALAQGRCHVAGFHAPQELEDIPRDSTLARALKPWLKPGEHKLLGSHLRVQGLMMRPGLRERIKGVRDIAGSQWRLVNRQVGSGTRLLMDEWMRRAGLDTHTVPGYHEPAEDTHLAVAAAIASGAADVGPGLQAAASQFGLDFVPLLTERYHLVVRRDMLESPGVQALRATLAGPAWDAALHTLPGHGAAPDRGRVLSLTQVLPWWRYPRPKQKTAKVDELSAGVGKEEALTADLVGGNGRLTGA